MVDLHVRLPAELHADLVKRAEEDSRSLNSELAVLLRKALYGWRQ
jgi:hypothetical protein